MKRLITYPQIRLSGDLFLPEMDTFFDKCRAWDNDPWIPPTNIREDKQGYLIELAIPGAKKEEIELEVENSRLIITSKTKGRFLKEYKSRNFSRSFSFPDNANIDTIKIRYENGILKINIAKKS